MDIAAAQASGARPAKSGAVTDAVSGHSLLQIVKAPVGRGQRLPQIVHETGVFHLTGGRVSNSQEGASLPGNDQPFCAEASERALDRVGSNTVRDHKVMVARELRTGTDLTGLDVSLKHGRQLLEWRAGVLEVHRTKASDGRGGRPCPAGRRHRPVTKAGPTALWTTAENAYAMWLNAGQPGWHRLGRTITPDRQWLWLDEPDGRLDWALTAR